MDGETPSLPSAAQGMTATHHPYRWQQRLRLPIKTPRPSRAAIPGRDRVLSVPMCLIRQPREMDGETPSLPIVAPIAPPRPSRAAIPGRDRVLSVPVCLIGELREWTVRHHPYQMQPREWTATLHPYQMQFGSRKVRMRACRANSETEADDFTIL